MSNFVYDGTSIPDGKTDLHPLNGTPTKYVTAAEWNTVMAAIQDLRAALIAGSYLGLSSAPTAGVSATGEVRLRSNAGALEASQDGGAYAALGGSTQVIGLAATSAPASVTPGNSPLTFSVDNVSEEVGIVTDNAGGFTVQTAGMYAMYITVSTQYLTAAVQNRMFGVVVNGTGYSLNAVEINTAMPAPTITNTEQYVIFGRLAVNDVIAPYGSYTGPDASMSAYPVYFYVTYLAP